MKKAKNSCVEMTGFQWNHFLANLDIMAVKAGYAENYSQWKFKHGFSEEVFYRLYYVVSGSFRLFFPSGSTVVEPGYFYLIPCDMLLKYEGIEPCNHYWIHFVSNQLKTIPFLDAPLRIPLAEPEPVCTRLHQS